MSQNTAKFAWASIAGANPEPVELIERDGRKGVLTIGCEDPFWLDDASAGVKLGAGMLVRPEPFVTREERDKRDAAYNAKMARDGGGQRYFHTHGWRGPR